MLGLDALASDSPPQLVLFTSTRRWLPDWELRETTAQFVRRVRRSVAPGFQYAWCREWTTGRAARSGGARRTHYHWSLKGVEREHQAALSRAASEVWGRRSGGYICGVQPCWDAAGIGRYMASLVGHHLKAAQAPPPGWEGRRVGTSKGYYALPARELRARAETLVREDALLWRLERVVSDEVLGDVNTLDAFTYDEFVVPALEAEYVRALREPAPMVVPVDRLSSLRLAA